MDWKPGDVVTKEFCTQTFATGVATNADSTPTGTVNRNGTDDGAVTVTVTNIDAGRYKAAFTIPATYIPTDVLNLTVSATVSTITGKDCIWTGRVGLGLPAAGTAGAGGASTITLQTALGADNLGKGSLIVLLSGTGAGQFGLIIGYVNSTKVVTVSRAWVTNPDSTTTYAILPADLLSIATGVIPAASGGLPTVGTGAGQINVDGAGNASANVLKINSDSTAPANLANTFNGTGYVATTAPAQQQQVANIAVTGAAINTIATGNTITTGTETGTYANTFTADQVYDVITAVGNAIDLYYSFSVGTTGGVGTSVEWLGYVSGVVNTIKVYAYNWAGSSWDQVGSIQGVSGTVESNESFDLTSAHTGTGGNLGLVRIRFANTGLTTGVLNTDRLLVGYATIITVPANFSALGISAAGKINEVVLVDTLTTYTGNSPQTGDAYAVVSNGTYGNAQLVRSTTPANTLTVDSGHAIAFNNTTIGTVTTLTNLPSIPANWLTAAGIAASALNGKGDWLTSLGTNAPTGWINTAAFASGATLPVVNLVNTLTTYTGNTPQTGDSFASIGLAGVGLTNIGDNRMAILSDVYLMLQNGSGGSGAWQFNSYALELAPTGGDGSGGGGGPVTVAEWGSTDVQTQGGLPLVATQQGGGDIPVDQNTGGTNNLQIVDENNNPIVGATIVVYLSSGYPNPASIQGQTTSNSDGSWVAPIYVTSGTYICYASKAGSFGSMVSDPFTV